MKQGSDRTALVTGASAGIGKAFAIELAKRGFAVALTARREDRLKELAREIEKSHGVKTHVIVADLADPAAPGAVFASTEKLGVPIDVLVNNAGYGVPGHYVSTTWKEQADFVQVLVTAVAHLSHLYLPGMVQRGYGRIANVASLAGLIPGAKGHTLYGASKAFLVKLSESLSLELAGTGVNVCAVCPGFTYSEFHDVVGNRSQVSQLPKILWMSAEDVARQGVDAVMRGDSVYVNGAVNQTIAAVVKHLPHAIAMRVMAQQSKRVRTGD